MKNIKEFCKQHGITDTQFYGEDKIEGYLNLENLTSIPKGFNPTVDGYLNLRKLTSIPKGFNPTVDGYLNLRKLTSIPKGFNPTVGGHLNLGKLTSIPKGFNPAVGGSLYLENLTSIPKGFNPTVGGSLYLGNLTSIPKGFNPTVGGYLNLGKLTSIPKGFNPAVGGHLDLGNGLKANFTKLNNRITSWQNGKYINADGMFTEVISKKGNIYTVKNLNSDKVFYLATDGKSLHAHGDTIEKAKEDLRYKKIADKLGHDPIKADTLITIKYYHIVTGSCDTGIRNWIDKVFEGEERAKIIEKGIKAKDLLPILQKENAYGYERFKSLVNF